MNSITYKFNGINCKDLGIVVSQSFGLTDMPKPKELLTANWSDEHGIEVDLANRVFEARIIKLNCYMKCNNEEDFISKSQQLNKLFLSSYSKGLVSLVIEFPYSKPLVYAVYLSGEINHTKKWRNGTFFSTFTLEFTEPEPMKLTYATLQETREVKFNFNSIKKNTFITLYTIKEEIMSVRKEILLREGSDQLTVYFNASNNLKNRGYIILTCNKGVDELYFSNPDNCILLTRGI
ncbi:phage tail family protein [Apibacter sp. wkB309]|uniref:phage tail family protein n=1 Tax=Apibacter sp. wkB309 TaxID=1679467 RepID=UPI000CF8B7DC|nr:phage tail family protein [Apibacter sp. wkB309]PQL89775.1 hypothetical protein C4S75_07230 [Apibacter sp. wkB309]